MELYKISFPAELSSKVYIGITSKTAAERFKEHCASRKAYPIVQAIRKYGAANAVLTVLAIYDDWNSLYAAEQAAIIEHGSRAPHGYNLTDGGPGTFGLPATEERKRKIGAANRGRVVSESRRRQISAHNKTRDLSKQIQAMAAANTGRPLTEAQRKAINWSGRTHTEESRRKMSESAKRRAPTFAGRTHSEETRRKISESQKARRASIRGNSCNLSPP